MHFRSRRTAFVPPATSSGITAWIGFTPSVLAGIAGLLLWIWYVIEGQILQLYLVTRQARLTSLKEGHDVSPMLQQIDRIEGNLQTVTIYFHLGMWIVIGAAFASRGSRMIGWLLLIAYVTFVIRVPLYNAFI